MNLKFLGTGGAFDYKHGNSAAWVEFNEKNILLDCGNSIYARLRQLDLADRIDYVLITHMHDDHVGSLSTVILHQRHIREPKQPTRILYPSTSNGRVLRDRIRAYLSFSLVRPEEYVEFVPLEEVAGIGHIDTKGMHVPDLISFGYFFENETEINVYSGDIGNQEFIFNFVRELNTPKKIRIFHDMAFVQTEGIHTYYKNLDQHLPDYELYAYHVDPTNEPEDNRIPLVYHHPKFMM